MSDKCPNVVLKSIAEWSAVSVPSVSEPAVRAEAVFVRVALEMVIVPPVTCVFTSLAPEFDSELVATNDVKFKVVPAVVIEALPPDKSLFDVSDVSLAEPAVVFSRNDRSIASPVPRSDTMVFIAPVVSVVVPIKPKVSLPAPPTMVTDFAAFI